MCILTTVIPCITTTCSRIVITVYDNSNIMIAARVMYVCDGVYGISLDHPVSALPCAFGGYVEQPPGVMLLCSASPQAGVSIGV